jgi:nitric oxide reductase NorD protein
MNHAAPQPEKVIKGLLDSLGGSWRALSVGIDRSRKSLPGYAVTPYGVAFGLRHQEQLQAVLERPGGERQAAAMASHVLAHLRFSKPFNDVGKLKDLSTALISILEDERVERRLADEIPGLRNLIATQFDPEYVMSMIGVEGALARIACALSRRANLFGDMLCDKALTALDRLDPATATFDDVRAAGTIIANDLGQLRYRFDRSRYEVWPPYRDDNSILWSDSRAEDRVHEVVSTQRDRSRAPPPLNAATTERQFLYDEWHQGESRYLPGHAVVVESTLDQAVIGRNAIRFSPVVSEQSHRNERHRRGRRRFFSESGDAVDLDRAVSRSVDLVCGIPPNERVYEVRLRFRTRFGVLLLLDASESANDRIQGTFSSVLDHERIALRHLSVLLASEATPFGVYSFQSDTHARVTIRAHKTLTEAWTVAVADDISAIRAHKSTRMGAAIRHMGTAAGHLTERTLVVVLTDGEPSDIDVPDGEYLIEDARRAVDELRSSGVTVLCLKVGAAGRGACERVFGRPAVINSEAGRLQGSLVSLVRSIRTESE